MVKVLDHVQHGGRWTRHEQQMNSLHDQVNQVLMLAFFCLFFPLNLQGICSTKEAYGYFSFQSSHSLPTQPSQLSPQALSLVLLIEPESISIFLLRLKLLLGGCLEHLQELLYL